MKPLRNFLFIIFFAFQFGFPQTYLLKYEGVVRDSVLAGSYAVNVSRDGRNVYVAAFDASALVWLTRDSLTGSIALGGALRDRDSSSYGLSGVNSIALSANGRNAYTTAFKDNAVCWYSRDTLNGSLRFRLSWQGVFGWQGLYGARFAALSADGRHLYVTAQNYKAINWFSCDTVTGMPTYDSLLKDNINNADGLNDPCGVVLSPDGRFVYVAAGSDDAVSWFSRDIATGNLSYLGMVPPFPYGMCDPVSLAMSPDGRFVYAAEWLCSGISWLSRDSATGTLTRQGLLIDGSGGVDGLNVPGGVTVSPNGGLIVVASFGDNAVSWFSRDSGAAGSLRYGGAIKDGAGGANGLAGARSVAMSPDGRFVYVAGSKDSAVSWFSVSEITMQAHGPDARPQVSGNRSRSLRMELWPSTGVLPAGVELYDLQGRMVKYPISKDMRPGIYLLKQK